MQMKVVRHLMFFVVRSSIEEEGLGELMEPDEVVDKVLAAQFGMNTPLKNGISFGEMKISLQQPQPDCKGHIEILGLQLVDPDEYADLVMVFQPQEYWKTLLKIGISFG